MQKNLLNLYEKHIYSDLAQDDFSKELWDIIPKKMSDISDILQRRLVNRKKISSNEIEDLRSIIKENLTKYGVFTSSVKEKLEKWTQEDPTFEIGHQPLFFGGGSFVYNKISYAIAISDYLKNEQNLSSFPFLFIGDHDQVQNELTITRFPQFQSYTGLELKFDYDSEYEDTPMAYLPLVKEEVLLNQLDKIRSNYRELFRFAKIKGEYRPLLEERLEQSLDMLYESFIQSNNFSDWIGRFWSKLFLLTNKAPIFVVKASDIKLRKLLLPYLEDMLVEVNRSTFISTINEYHDKIIEAGYKPGLSRRDEVEAPFFYECPNCVYKSRIKLEKTGKSLEGKCPTCSEVIHIEYNENNPDLSDHYQNLSPRVETRSVVINQLLKALLRVTGGGETTYHAQIIPYLRKRNFTTPIIMKNPRIYYNTPWAEKIAMDFQTDDLKPLQTPDFFKLQASISKSSSFEELSEKILATKNYLAENIASFKQKEEILTNKLSDKKDKKLQKQLDTIQLYLSHNYGTFQSGKEIQEVSWNWIDLALLTSPKDLFGFYARRIKNDLPISSTFWLSVGRYN